MILYAIDDSGYFGHHWVELSSTEIRLCDDWMLVRYRFTNGKEMVICHVIPSSNKLKRLCHHVCS